MNAINVYIPENLKHLKSGFLHGVYLRGNCNNGITEPAMIIIDENVEDTINDKVIGEISESCNSRNHENQSVWVLIKMDPFLINITISESVISLQDLNIIFYNPSQIKQSFMLGNSNLSCEYFSRSMEFFFYRVQNGYAKEKNVLRSYIYHQHKLQPLYEILTIYFPIAIYVSILETVNEFLLKRFEAKSFLIQQSVLRLKQIGYVNDGFDGKCKLIKMRVLGALLFDILLGIFCVHMLIHWTSSSELLNYFVLSTELIASNVQKLLTWLSGAPAGLKLNQPLSETLASFFSYHVYLWTLYLGVARSVLAVMAKLFVVIGLFGISLQISLLADFLNLGVLHIHTFYIYAARLHMLQVSLLGSQWRGFRGRKWNPLKERVDTRSEYRQRPLIKVLSAFGFTFVLFLMPTTAVYYTVFVVLRLLLLAIQGFVSFLLWALNTNPAYIAYLHITGSSYLKGNPYYELLPNESHDPNDSFIKLRLTIGPSSFGDSVTATHSKEVFPEMPKPNVGHLWQSLIYANKLL